MEILFEDTHLLVINKIPGRIVEGLVKDGILSLQHELQKQRNHQVFPCHRLDRDTTGVLVFAKNQRAHAGISQQFADHRIRKSYLACVQGAWNPAWNRVKTKISRTDGVRMANSDDGKESLTTFRRLAEWNETSLLEALPKTGRTHQIRLHCLFHQCPIMGDGLYGKRTEGQPPMALHARKLQLKHPISKQPMEFIAPLPDYWRDYWLVGCPVEIS